MSLNYESDPEWKTPKMKLEKAVVKREGSNTSSVKPKYMQRFCDKWLNLFDPWLARCDDDPNKPFCRACQCRLDCNRCHLQRHERTTKHARNLEILINKGEGAARQNLSIRQERSKYYQQRKKLNYSQASSHASDGNSDSPDYIEETDADNETSFHFVQTEGTPLGYSEESYLKQETSTGDDGSASLQDGQKNQTNPKRVIKKERMKLLMQIQRDKNELINSYKELIDQQQVSPPRDKNHVDLFFESVSSTVQAFPPKLIAESKMRISQLLCELEMRSLSENGTTINASNSGTTVVLPDGNTVGGAFIFNQSMVLQDQHDESVLQEYETLS